MAAVHAITNLACCPRCERRSRYLRDLADAMSLRDWVVLVAHDASEAGTLAQVAMAPDRRELTVAFCEHFDELDEYDQRLALVHELVHPHLRNIWSAVEDGAHEAFGGMAFRVYSTTVRRELERSVDAVATVLAPFLPHPSE